MTTQDKCRKVYHVKKDDQVQVITGRWKEKSGKVITILKKKDRVVLELQGVSDTGKRTVKKSAANPKGGMIDRSVSVHVSNVKKMG